MTTNEYGVNVRQQFMLMMYYWYNVILSSTASGQAMRPTLAERVCCNDEWFLVRCFHLPLAEAERKRKWKLAGGKGASYAEKSEFALPLMDTRELNSINSNVETSKHTVFEILRSYRYITGSGPFTWSDVTIKDVPAFFLIGILSRESPSLKTVTFLWAWTMNSKDSLAALLQRD